MSEQRNSKACGRIKARPLTNPSGRRTDHYALEGRGHPAFLKALPCAGALAGPTPAGPRDRARYHQVENGSINRLSGLSPGELGLSWPRVYGPVEARDGGPLSADAHSPAAAGNLSARR